MEDVRDVMVGAPGDKAGNVLVLGGVDVVIPLDMDLDSDPLQDDEVWLRRPDGSVVQVLYSSDPDVERNEEQRLFFYGFRDVPYGIYTVSVKVADQLYDAIRGLVVCKDGVFINGEKLSNEWKAPPPSPAPAPAPDPAPEAPGDPAAALQPWDDGAYLDQEDV
jgi:hypothetical protein